MERLTWQNKDSTNYVDGKHIKQENYYDSGNIVYRGKAVERLAEYESTELEPSEVEKLKQDNEELRKRLENSVELPCKVGDTIYWFDKYEKVPSIYMHTVSDITIHENGVTVRCEAIPTTYYFSTIHFGKIAFLTREEAKTELEKFLKECE